MASMAATQNSVCSVSKATPIVGGAGFAWHDTNPKARRARSSPEAASAEGPVIPRSFVLPGDEESAGRGDGDFLGTVRDGVPRNDRSSGSTSWRFIVAPCPYAVGGFEDGLELGPHRLGLEDPLPVRLEQHRLGLGQHLEGAVRVARVDLPERDRQLDVDVAHQERAGRLGRHPAADRLVEALLDHHHRRGRGRLRERGLEDRHLLDGDPVGLDHRVEEGGAQGDAAVVVGLAALQQRADDVLLRLHAAEEVALGLEVGLVVEDRRVAGVGHEVRDVGALEDAPGARAPRGRGARARRPAS